MDKRISYKIVIDTEACPIDPTIETVDPFNMLTYDAGWSVVDKRGNVYLTRSFVVAEIFFGESARMASAYYANKIPQYFDEIESGERIVARWATIRRIFLEDCAAYNVKQIYAHNMRFDYGTLKVTASWITKQERAYFFPYGVEICDTLKMARDVLGAMPSYRRFCAEHGFCTKNGQPRYTAEIIYRFISQDVDFVEHHTGLEDVMIEKEIMAYCYRQHKKMRRLLWEK